MSTCAVVFGASTSVKVEAVLIPLTERGRPLGASRPVRALLAGPLEYKEHSEVLWDADRGSRECLPWLQ